MWRQQADSLIVTLLSFRTISRKFQLRCENASSRKDGDRLSLEPAERKSLVEVLATLDELDEAFPAIEDPPPEPVDLFSRESPRAWPARRR